MKKVKIYGAGSIGNHLAQASRRMGWSVDICDIDVREVKNSNNFPDGMFYISVGWC